MIDLSRDVLREDGSWARSYMQGGNQVSTKAAQLYKNMLLRCRKNSIQSEHRRCYATCSVEFKDFQDFAKWATSQPGYGVKGYQLDKDLLSEGKKVYSKDTCCFLPDEVNKLIVDSNYKRSEFGAGVTTVKSGYRAKIRIKNKMVSLGNYSCPTLAAEAYKSAKAKVFLSTAEEYKGFIDDKAYLALIKCGVS